MNILERQASAGSSTRRNSLRLLNLLVIYGMLAAPSFALNFVFDIEYLGNDLTQLATGSDEPDGTSLDPGDTFQWTISSSDHRYWFVETSGDFFPLMAFNVNPGGTRSGDFDLTLRNNGTDVFSLSETDVRVAEVHLGTNSVTLPMGLIFDEMFLDYTLDSAVDVNVPPNPITTTISGRLPIFGAPENNQFSPGIAYVPEPGSSALLLLAVGAWRPRRRRQW